VGYQPGAGAEPESRASALAYTLAEALPRLNEPVNGAVAINQTLYGGLSTVEANLQPPKAIHRRVVLDELNSCYFAEQQLEVLVQSLSLRCYAPNFFSMSGQDSQVCSLIAATIANLDGKVEDRRSIPIPPDVSSSLAALAFNWPGRRQG
jgi:hypothetical protein